MSLLYASVALIALYPAAASGELTVEETIAGRFPGVEAEHVRPTPLPGLWEVAVGGQVVYLSADGRFMLRGELMDLLSGRNLTEQREAELRMAMIVGLDERRMVVFAPDKPKHMVTVVTDIDCGYCRRFHREIADYNRRGIGVRYLFYPLSGPGSVSWAKADAVWCSPNRHDAMTRAKLGEDVQPTPPCNDTPVAEHYRMAGELGVRGTPAIISDDGLLLPGYVPAGRLAVWLDEQGR